jgi:protein-disulfide isomerase
VSSGSASLGLVEEVSGMFQVITSYQGSQIPIFVSKDGTFLFLSAPINMSKEVVPQTSGEQPATEVPKTDKPVANGFVMSHCPYGLQFLKAYIPVIELLGSKADLNVNFVSYIMHGESEMSDNTIMYCIQKEEKSKFTQYLRCFVDKNDATTCMATAGISKAKIDTCTEAADKEFSIKKTFAESTSTYPAYNVDAALDQQYGVQGSPTFVLNGVTVGVNRAPEAIKQAVCSAFNNPPAECNQTLSTAAEAAGFGPLGSGSASNSTASCG